MVGVVEGRGGRANEDAGADAVLASAVPGAGVMKPLGAGDRPMPGELIDGGVNVDVTGVESVGEVTIEDVAVAALEPPNGRGGGLTGAGRGKHGAGNVVIDVLGAGFGFATG